MNIVHISGLTQAIGNNFPTNYMQKKKSETDQLNFVGFFVCLF